ncbi:sensor histidine kinase [Allosphingosinicella sp.]|jgi:PAS domain S-box-containing protein|uniref:sensor histidine kinase n=1 Tax=Allosphingosinicella sp. TaxID=2823234 RepID=UPI002F1FFC83
MPELQAFLSGGGEMGALIRAEDWSSTPLGPIHDWPQSLRSTLGIALRSTTASAVYWGPGHLFLYNDAWAALLVDRHPWALGRPAEEVLKDVWPILGDQFGEVLRNGQAINMVDTLLVRNLGGAVFDSYWSYSLLPVASEDGTIGGVLAQVRESTKFVLRARRDAMLLRLAEQLRQLGRPEAMLEAALDLISEELDAARIGYAEVDEKAGTISILACATRGDSADISGSHRIPDFGATINDDLRAGRTIRIDDAATDPRLAEPEIRRRYDSIGVKSALVVPIVSDERYRAMLFAHHDGPRSWTDHHEALLRQATEHVWREISRARAEAALRDSEERYRRIFEQANDLIITADLSQIITDCNPAAADAMEMSRDEIIGRSITDFLTPAGADQAREMLGRKLDRGGTTRHELDVISRSGKILNWEINSTLTLDPSGRPVGLHAIARDVTERRRAEERQRLLVNELNHRVKNTLALVQGLALQSFKDGRDPGEAREAFQKRLAALATAHDLLTRESWEGATLERLVEEALGHHNAQDQRIGWAGPPVTLNPKAAVSLVMALHELSTNAAKYGAMSVPEGRVTVSWQLTGPGRLGIEWRERGGPPVAPPARRGFGFRMIERALAADLAGGARLDFEREGLVCRIDASLHEAAARSAAA